MQQALNEVARLGGNQSGGGSGGWAGGSSAPESITSSVSRQARVPIVGPGGRVVAVIVGGVLTKSVDGSIHFLRNPPAIALDAHALAEAGRLGVTHIAVTDRETGRVYRASLADLRAHGWQFDRGYGLQVAMRLAGWHVEGDQVQTIEPPAVAQPQAAARQLALW